MTGQQPQDRSKIKAFGGDRAAGARPVDQDTEEIPPELLAQTMADLDAMEALWGPRYADLNAYRARIRVLVGHSLPHLAAVWCDACRPDDHRRRRLGVILDSPDGPLLVTWRRVPLLVDRRTVTPAERKALGYGRPQPRPEGWILDGPNTYAARFPWRPPSAADDDIPEIRCGTHGTLTPDLDQLRAAVRSGWRAVRVTTGGDVHRA
jgi:hypothetical protein